MFEGPTTDYSNKGTKYERWKQRGRIRESGEKIKSNDVKKEKLREREEKHV